MPEYKLHQAVQGKILDHVKSLVEKGDNVNEVNERNEIPLHRAIAMEEIQLDIVKYLIDNGSSINAKNEDGNTFLHYTVFKDQGYAKQQHNMDVIKLLIEKGASVNEKSNKGFTALHIAVEYGHQEIASLLIINKVNLNLQDKDGNTPIHIAVEKMLIEQNNYTTIADTLISAGASLDITNNCDETILHIAINGGLIKFAESIIDRDAQVTFKNKKGNTYLHFATKKGFVSTINTLIDKKVDLNAKNHKTALKGNNAIFNLLLDNGADPSICDNVGNTILHYAVFSKKVSSVQLVLSKSPEMVNLQNKDGNTPLHAAYKNGHKEIAELLTRNGAGKKLRTLTSNHLLILPLGEHL